MTFSISSSHPQRAARHRTRREWPTCGIANLFAATCACHADTAAIVDGAVRLTFREWDRRSETLARHMLALGLGPGSVVAYQLPNWWEAAVVFLAAARIGAIVNPLLPIFRAHELRFILGQSRASLLFLPESFRGIDYPAMIAGLRGALPDLVHVVTVRGGARAAAPCWQDLQQPADGNPAGEAASRGGAPEDLLLLMYTSGTTAEPKGVLHTHATLISEVHSLARVHSLGPTDVTLMPSPLTHISGVLHGILAPALLGTRAVLMDRWDAPAGLARIEEEGVTYMVGAPTFLRDLVAQAERAGRAPRSLRLFSCGGAPVNAELIGAARARLGCVAKRVYGSTEFPTITCTDADDAAEMGAETEGRAIAPAELRIATAAGGTAGSGEEGEVQARGPECFVGYADVGLNDEAFTPDGWFRTGDLGRLDERGYLTITGRLKEIIIRKGEKISVREIEDQIAAHPDVRGACVVPLADAARGEIACAVLALRAGATLDLEQLGEFLRQRGLAAQKLPEKLLLLPDLPLTESGKVHRAAIRARAARDGGDGTS